MNWGQENSCFLGSYGGGVQLSKLCHPLAGSHLLAAYLVPVNGAAICKCPSPSRLRIRLSHHPEGTALPTPRSEQEQVAGETLVINI